MTSRLGNVPLPSEEEVKQISTLFNEALAREFRPDQRSFYKLFKAMDLDGSHRISFHEARVEAARKKRSPLARLGGADESASLLSRRDMRGDTLYVLTRTRVD